MPIRTAEDSWSGIGSNQRNGVVRAGGNCLKQRLFWLLELKKDISWASIQAEAALDTLHGLQRRLPCVELDRLRRRQLRTARATGLFILMVQTEHRLHLDALALKFFTERHQFRRHHNVIS